MTLPGTLPDLSDDRPAGENLEFDPAFAEMERLAQGKPEQQYGATLVPAEDPEWKEVLAAAEALLERTYDLRVLAQLGVARLHLPEGPAGYAETLLTVRRLLETRWAAIHPQLDPEDDNDPTLRANALLALAAPARVLRVLRVLPLARSQRAGTVSWRDISILNGTLEVADDDTPRLTESMVAAAFRESDPESVLALRTALDAAAEHGNAIPAAFDENAGYGTGPDFSELTRLLREMVRMIDTYAVAAAPAAALADDADSPVPDAAAFSAASPGPRAGAAVSIATLGPPTNRADAGRLLELVIEYYERHEPSSPLPLLLARARRLADMGFMEILRDMAPDGVSQAELIAGRLAGESD